MYISETSHQKDFNQITKSLIRIVMSDVVTEDNWEIIHKDNELIQFKRKTIHPAKDDELEYTEIENVTIDEMGLFFYQVTTLNVKDIITDDIIELQFNDKEEMTEVMGEDFVDNFYQLLKGKKS